MLRRWMLFLLKLIYVASVHLSVKNPGDDSVLVVEALNAVLGAAPQYRESILLVVEEDNMLGDVGKLRAPWGVGVFEVATDGQATNRTQLAHVGGLARQLRQVSWSVTVVVVSDDPAFLTTFTEWSLKGRLLVWSTRLLVLTRLPLHSLHHLCNTLAMTNSMLLLFSNTTTFRCTVYLELPYSADNRKYQQVCRWTAEKGLTYLSNMQVFPEKFERLLNKPSIQVTYVKHSSTKTNIVDDPNSENGKREIILDPVIRLVEIIAEHMNFKLQIKKAATWGGKLPNGSYTGMVGLIQRKEADLSLNLLHATYQRAQVVDFTFPLTVWYSFISVRRGNPEVDPWGFLLPFKPFVWLGVLAALLGVIVVLILMPYCLSDSLRNRKSSFQSAFVCVRVLLKEDLPSIKELGWCERLVLGVWMLMMLVLTQSYAGNLMSLLAVRYIPMPVNNLQDVLDTPVIVVTPAGTTVMRSFTEAKGGLLRKIGDLANVGRFQPVYVSQMTTSLDQHVRRGTHVIIAGDFSTRMIAQDFSEKGRCDFYQPREKILPMLACYAISKDFPLFPAINRRVMRLAESGILRYWEKMYITNLTACLRPPKTVAVRSSLSFTNLWGMFVVLAGGGVAGTLVFCLERLSSRGQHN